MCFSLAWFAHFLIMVIVIGGAVALLMLLVRFVGPKIGMTGEILAFVVQAFTIVFWVIVCVAAVVFIFGLISCVLGGAGGNLLHWGAL